ncbi:MAG: YitT family protein, partial [Chitinispirillia bacterium]|nr:YitT family protein [Chitinispirillia bacterium]MCL2241710.1 YitT family protein [Chitinispirillia bacterium]
LLSALVAGILNGAGVALILRTNGTCSGTEIISIIINRIYSVNLSTTNLVMNAMVMAVACFFLPIENVLYSFVFVAMNSQAMNSVFKGLAKRKAVMIISKHWKEILDTLTREKRIGVTLLSAKGGYSGIEEPILYSIVRSHHVSVVSSVTMNADPAAFIVIMETTDIINDTIGNQPPWKKHLDQARRKKKQP